MRIDIDAYHELLETLLRNKARCSWLSSAAERA